MIGRWISNLWMWLVLGVIGLMILATTLIFLGIACWAAFAIWRVVFGFFM